MYANIVCISVHMVILCEGWFPSNFPFQPSILYTHGQRAGADYIFVWNAFVCSCWLANGVFRCCFFAFYFIAHLFMYFIIVTDSKSRKTPNTISATPLHSVRCSPCLKLLPLFTFAQYTNEEYVIYSHQYIAIEVGIWRMWMSESENGCI